MGIEIVTDNFRPAEPSEPATDILDPRDLFRLYRIKEGTQKSLRSRGLIPFYKLGGGKIIRYKRSEIEAWLAAHAKPVTGGAR